MAYRSLRYVKSACTEQLSHEPRRGVSFPGGPIGLVIMGCRHSVAGVSFPVTASHALE